MISDHDMTHLVPQPSAVLSHFLAWIGCQAVSLACAYQAREEKSRDDEARFRREPAQLKGENERLRIENAKLKDDFSHLNKKFEDKSRDGDGLHKEFSALYEKHYSEVQTGGQFLSSVPGQSFVKEIEEKAVNTFRASPVYVDELFRQAFGLHDEVVRDCRHQFCISGQVSEEIVMLIGPNIPDLVDVAPMAEPLEGDGDTEVIDALKLLPVDETTEDG